MTLCICQRAEDETARLYQEFVESFQGDNAPGSKTFVRGGTINPNDRYKPDSEGQLFGSGNLQFIFSLTNNLNMIVSFINFHSS